MAIVIDGYDSVQGTGTVGAQTASLTVPAGTETAVICMIYNVQPSDGAPSSTATFDGQSCTNLIAPMARGELECGLWVVQGFDTGAAKTFAYTIGTDATTGNVVGIHAHFMSGVDVTPVDSDESAGLVTNTEETVTLTGLSTGDYVFVCGGTTADDDIAVQDQTPRTGPIEFGSSSWDSRSADKLADAESEVCGYYGDNAVLAAVAFTEAVAIPTSSAGPARRRRILI